MDFLDPKKKRSHIVRLYIGYVLVAIALGLASVLLLFAAFGYGIDRTTGSVTQNGLLFVDAHPESARIKINGQDRGQTDGRFVLEEGQYNVELTREGYRTWARDFTMRGSQIVRLVYPFMFPKELRSTDVDSYVAAPDMVTESPDRKWIVQHFPDKPAQLSIVDTSDKDLPQVVTNLPAGLFTDRANVRLELTEWSTDNRHMLVKASFDGGSDFLVLDRQDGSQSYSVAQTFGKPFAVAALRDKKFDKLYLQEVAGGSVLAADIQSKALEITLSQAQAFWPYKSDMLLYISTENAPAGKAQLRLKDGKNTYTIRDMTPSDGYQLNMAEFEDDLYVTAASSADGRIYIYKNPIESIKDTKKTFAPSVVMRLDGVQYLTFSGNARFIGAQAGAQFAIYDIETMQQYKYDAKIALPANYKAKWMDGHRLMLVGIDNKLTVFDYDNTNVQSLVTTNNAFAPLFDRDYNRMYTVSPTKADANKTGLIWTDLNLGQD